MERPSPAKGWDCHVHIFDPARPARRGHYRPMLHTLAQIEAVSTAHHVRHLVLVQPSIYGSDNSLMLQALARDPGRHRAVVVLDTTVNDIELDALHAAGVRGARLNLVSPVGERESVEQRFDALAPRLRRLGWHLQWYVQSGHLPRVAALHAGSGVTCVLDHLGGVCADTPADDPAWPALAALAAEGGWLKLSGWYRLQAVEPYTELHVAVRRLAGLFGTHLVWGSDWPHTTFEPDAMPAYASTWRPVVDALGADSATHLRDQVPAIYA